MDQTIPLLIYQASKSPVQSCCPRTEKFSASTTEKAEMWSTVPQPDADINVKVTPRKGDNSDEKLNVIFLSSDKAMELSAEDIESKVMHTKGM